jgi:predicted  nucleic acid-binding Zn-ribbon protein
MNQPIAQFIVQLLALSEIDIAIARTKADLNAAGKKVEIRKQELAKIDAALKIKQASFDEASLKYKGEERWLRDEQQKLVDRRKGLATLNNYKLQQAAEREIEKSSHQLTLHEERLLASLEKLETLEKEVLQLKERMENSTEEITKLQKDSQEELDLLNQRMQEKSVSRATTAADIDTKILREYDLIRQRFTMDPVVSLTNGTCGGCHMSVPRQMIVMISRAETITRCRGCSRILYLPEQIGAVEKSEEKTA